MKILRIETEEYEGNVYNLGVNNIHNYFSNNILIHNCYQDSTEDQEHYNIDEFFYPFFRKMNSNQRPFQIACLHENTIIPSVDGVKDIKNFHIGDVVFDERGNKTHIRNIIKSRKKVITLIGSKGFKVTCTKDHVFLDENMRKVKAEDTLHKNLLLVKPSFVDKENLIKDGHIIDMSIYGNKSSKIFGKRGGSSGMVLTDNKVSLMHTMKLANRFIKIDKDLMWLYGLCVAEGTKRTISLHKDELSYRNRVKKIYDHITGLELPYYETFKKNGYQLQVYQPKFWESIFFKEMKIGYGSRNKSIKYLYNCSNDLIKSALIGMFDGDGSYRRRVDNRTNRVNFGVSYKTSSKVLAYELVDILYRRFGIYASLHYGINPERNIEDRNLPITDYYMIDIYGKENIGFLFEDRFRDIYEDYDEQEDTIYSGNKYNKFISINEIIDEDKYAIVYDLMLDKDSSHLFTLSHGVITHNCGGGEPTLHPNFSYIMKSIRSLDIAPNYTTNGTFIYNDNCTEILNATKKYCEGVAVTCHKHLDEIWKKAVEAYIHMGIFTNLHILIYDWDSIQYFSEIFHTYKDSIQYFVLLPLVTHGRAKDFDVDLHRACEDLSESIKNNTYGTKKKYLPKIAFGAMFYPYMNAYFKDLSVSLYEPEIMSKYLDLKDGAVYKSSFDTNYPLYYIGKK